MKLYCFGDFKLFIDNKILKFKVKAQQKPIELLKVLISLGGKNVSESTLSDILWPDADGDMQRQNFNTTLHRLRKILRVSDILQLRSGQLSINEERCWSDVWAFQYLLQSPETYQDFQNFGEEKAISLYKGKFLQNEIAWWTNTTREKLQRKFLSTIELLGKRFMDRSLWEKAANFYEKGLEIETSTTEFYLQLMQCYSNLGHKASAIKIHEKYMEKFSSKRDRVYHNIQILYHKINETNLNCR